jgi:hypothetical protein
MICNTRNKIFIKTLTPLLTGLVLLISSNSSSAATCHFPSDVTIDPGGSFFKFYILSNFASSMYFFNTSTSGDFSPVGLNVQGFPGITTNKGKGFSGTSTTMGVSFFVHPNVQTGSQSYITISVVSLAGQTVCSGTFTITVDGSSNQQQWTNWLDRDNPSGTGDWENRTGFPSGEVCGSPTDIEARVRGTTSVFSPYDPRPETLQTFTASDGLVCRNIDQADGFCNDYEVRFLCPQLFGVKPLLLSPTK